MDNTPEKEENESNQRQSVKAWQAGSEFLGGVITGVLLGAIVDYFFDTSPWAILIGLLLGFATGFWNVYRLMLELNTTKQKNKK